LFLQKESEVSKPHTPKPPYSAQFREQMIELVRAGRTPSELAKEFGCHATSIHNWLRQADSASGAAPAQGDALTASERQELLALRRQLRQVQMERDILAKATAWFAGKSEKTFTPSTNS
jgi:transposase